MKMGFVYGILPYILFYTINLPDAVGGRANACIVRIKPKYLTDIGIHKHELCHVRQFYRTLGIHGLLYKISLKYRLMSEIEAYREQLKYYQDDKTAQFAGYICECYGLDVGYADVVNMLRGA